MTVDVAIALALRWLRLACSFALLAVIVLSLAQLFGLTLIRIPSIGWQEFGVFVAGTAYALKNL